MARRLEARSQGQAEAACRRAAAQAGQHLLEPRPARDRRLLRALDLRLRPPDLGAGRGSPAGRPAEIAGHREEPRPTVGPELGGRPGGLARARRQGPQPARARGGGEARVRADLHDVPAADLRALHQPLLRSLLPLGRDVQARGGRDRPGRPGGLPLLALLRLRLPLQEGLLQLADGQGREVQLLLSADRGRPADRLLDPDDPEVREQARRDGIADDWLEAASRSPVYAMCKRWRIALPLHPEYRTLPMVWYVPPLSPVESLGESLVREGGDPEDVFEAIEELRIPVEILSCFLSSCDPVPVRRSLRRLVAMRLYLRAKNVAGGEEAGQVLDRDAQLL